MANVCYTCLMYESHRCRNESTCPEGMHYEEYTGSTVKQCLEATTEVYQDGYIHCPIIDSDGMGCKWCVEEFGDGSNWNYDESQNYERKPRWRKENGMRNCGLPKGYEDQCCLNRSGMCTLDTADYSDIDRAVGMRGCGFIGVNDRYLIWKHGVPYKEFVCGSCRHYEGETHGVCTNEQVKPHLKGITENGEKVYIDSKEYYSGAHACGYFNQQEEVKEVAKKQYWTKCGREFTKNSTAEVTGYELNELDGKLIVQNCIECPFPIEIKDGWGETATHKRWECRAGSKPPNNTTEWTGSLEDKNTLSIHSLDHQLMEEIYKFCKEHPDLGAGYNADHKADCRRTLSISCSSNKKGIAAKREMIEKFFPAPNEEVSFENDNGLYYCEQEDCPFNDRECGCCFGSEDHDDGFADDLVSAINEHECQNENVQFAYKLIRPEKHIAEEEPISDQINWIENADTPQETIETPAVTSDAAPKSGGENIPSHGLTCATCDYRDRKRDDGRCQRRGNDVQSWPEKYACGWYSSREPRIMGEKIYVHDYPNGLYADGSDASYIDYLGTDIKRAYYLDGLPGGVETDKSEITNKLIESASDMSQIGSFDYSVLDGETADYLRGKVETLMRITLQTMTDIGRELCEAQDKLAKHGYGCFEAWYTYLGFKKDNVYNLINRYRLICRNPDKQDLIESLPKTLVAEIAKPTVVPEVREAVLSGDITTHKDYKDLEKRLKESEERAERALHQKTIAENKAIEASQEIRKTHKMRDDSIKAFTKDINNLHQQLEQAKRNADPKKVQELGKVVSEKQQEIESLRQQLKDQPIEVAATRIVIPDEVRDAIYSKVAALYEGLLKLTDTEIQIFAEEVGPQSADTVIENINDAICALNSLHTAVCETQEA